MLQNSTPPTCQSLHDVPMSHSTLRSLTLEPTIHNYFIISFSEHFFVGFPLAFVAPPKNPHHFESSSSFFSPSLSPRVCVQIPPGARASGSSSRIRVSRPQVPPPTRRRTPRRSSFGSTSSGGRMTRSRCSVAIGGLLRN